MAAALNESRTLGADVRGAVLEDRGLGHICLTFGKGYIFKYRRFAAYVERILEPARSVANRNCRCTTTRLALPASGAAEVDDDRVVGAGQGGVMR
jgi:hypothetical protein